MILIKRTGMHYQLSTLVNTRNVGIQFDKCVTSRGAPANFFQSDGHFEHDTAKTVFLGGLPLSSTKEKIISYLRRFGKLERIVLPRDPVSKRIKGYGKAIFTDSRSAQLALDTKEHWLKGIKFGVMPWLESSEYEQMRTDLVQRKVYVKHRSQHTKEALLAYFEQFGHVEAIDMRLSFSSNKPRNFCYVVFESSQSALAVINTLEHLLDGLPVLCEMCKPTKKNSEKYMHRFEEQSAGIGLHEAQHSFWADGPSPSQPLSNTLEFVTRTEPVLREGHRDLSRGRPSDRNTEKSLYGIALKDESCSGEDSFGRKTLRTQKHQRGVGEFISSANLRRYREGRVVSHDGEADLSSVCTFAQMVWKPTSLNYSPTARAHINDRHDASNGLLLFTIARPRCL